MLFDIKTYIGFESMTLTEITDRLSHKSEYKAFGFIFTDKSVNDIRSNILYSLDNSPVFKAGEYNERLTRLFSRLGTSDKQSQIELITGTVSYFEGQADMLRNDLAVKKRLYNSLGIAAGALISILLL